MLAARWRPILLSTVVLAAYGSIIWPIALECGCWAYGSDEISGVKILGYVYIDDVVGWLPVALAIALVLGFEILNSCIERIAS